MPGLYSSGMIGNSPAVQPLYNYALSPIRHTQQVEQPMTYRRNQLSWGASGKPSDNPAVIL